MLRDFGSKKGQVISGEYVVAVLLIIAAIVMMSSYFRRALQARVFDGQRKAMADVSNILGNKVPAEYEPYYALSSSNADSYVRDSSRAFSGGVINRTINTEQVSRSVSNQLQPGLGK